MELVGDPFTVLDGGLSTALELLGHDVGGELWTARLLLVQPDAIVEAHASYVAAGAEVLITASYQASVQGFERAGASRTDALRALTSTTRLARAGAARTGADVLVAASCGPYGAILADRSEYHGRYEATWGEVRRFHRERLAVLAATEPDLFAVETIPTRVEAEIVLEELLVHPGARAWVSFVCPDGTHTGGGDELAAAVTMAVGSPQVVAVGVNCTAPEHVEELLHSAGGVTDLPLVAYANFGTPGRPPTFDDDLDARLDRWLEARARLVGGCCGVGPASIAALAAEKRRRGA